MSSRPISLTTSFAGARSLPRMTYNILQMTLRPATLCRGGGVIRQKPVHPFAGR